MSDPASSRSGSKPPGFWEPPSLETMQALLPQYEFVCLLGRGGMGAVYKARQISLDRLVAVKVLPGDLLDDTDVNFVQRFKQEARTMARMNHPAIVGVYDFGETQGGLLYFVMEFVDGTDVAQMILAQRLLPPEYAVAISAHVCDALAYAHAHGVVHRDIKPANVLINMDGQVKVADFGLAKAHDAADHGLTKTNMAMGTPDFVAPEALMPGMALDGRADLYAVGVMLYQMLTGEIPRGLWQMPSLKIGADARFDAIIAKAMQTDREMRYQSSQEIRQDLDRIVAMPAVQAGGQASVAIPKQAVVSQTPVTKGPQPRKEPEQIPPPPTKKSRSGIMMAITFGAVACVVVGFAVKGLREPPEEPAPSPPVASTPPPRPKPAPQKTVSKPAQPEPPKVTKTQEPKPAFSAPAPVLNDKAQDILPRVDLEQDVVAGNWRRQGTDLVLEKRVPGNNARVELPVLCSGSYLVEVEFSLGTEVGDFAVHLPFAAQPGAPLNDVTLRLVSGKGSTAPVGFEYFAGKGVHSSQSPAASKIEPLKTGRNHLLTRVRFVNQDRIALALWFEGRPVLEWEGERKELSGAANVWRPANGPRFAIGTNSLAAIIHRVRIQPQEGDLQWLREVPPSLPAPAPAPAAVTAAPPDPVAIRLKEIEKQFQEAFEKQAGAAHTAAVADLNKKYEGALDRAIATASQSSKLDEALKLREEKDLIRTQAAIPADDASATLPSLKSFRDTYRKTLAGLAANLDKAAAPVYAAYDRALANYQDELTRAQKLDEAQRVKAVRDHVTSQRDSGAATVTLPPAKAPSPSVASGKPSAVVVPVAPPLAVDKILPTPPRATPEEVRELIQWCINVRKGNVRIREDGSDRQIKSMDDMPKGKFSLVHFYIYEVPMNEEGIKWLSLLGRVPELESMFFHKNPGKFPVEIFRGLTKLKDLHLTPTSVDDAAFAHLSGLKNLEKLAITYFCEQFTGTGLGYINDGLQELETDSKTLSAEGLAYLPRFKRLKRLVLRDCSGITDSMLKGLAGLPELEHLDVSLTKLDGSFLAHVAANPKLRSLVLTGMKNIKPEHLPLLTRLTNLQFLALPALDLTSEGMAAVAALPKLTSLEIEDAPFTGQGFAGTSGFGNLVSLNISRCPITDEGWAAMAGAVPGLRNFTFGRYTGSANGPISAKALGIHLSKLRNLNKLTFSYTGIDDAWLPALPPLRNLTEIVFSGTSVTDAVIPILKSLPKLEKAGVGGTKLSEQGKAEVARLLGK